MVIKTIFKTLCGTCNTLVCTNKHPMTERE
jgi:hypothetical protein